MYFTRKQQAIGNLFVPFFFNSFILYCFKILNVVQLTSRYKNRFDIYVVRYVIYQYYIIDRFLMIR